MGSCEMNAMPVPRKAFISRSLRDVSSTPLKETDSATISAPRGSTRRTPEMVMDFPQPDSPTMPRASPGRTSKLTPSTIRSRLLPRGRSTDMRRTLRTGAGS
jgi:hypothetical protein